MKSLAPKKSLGQNFLTSIPARNAIIAAGEALPTDYILEIGPGKGFLTAGLLATGATVLALEKDRELVPYLTNLFRDQISDKKLTVVEGDVLTFVPKDHFVGQYKIIANIPYYITGAIISRYLSNTHQPTTMVVLIQKEVAERICAKDGKESLLSLSVKVYGDPKLYYKVSRGSFFPAPKVDSAVLQVKNISRNKFVSHDHERVFFELIHAGFAHKRKLAKSNIAQVFKDKDITTLFSELQLNEKIRAEDITLFTWLSLAEKLIN
jgi:16S rRNA (adenine1518-N6/adenine1519-N6)-dimethyltransferase